VAGVRWHEDDRILFALAVAAIGSWFLPEQDVFRCLVWVLALGLFFDVFSLACHLSKLIIGRYSSGLPGLGLVCYSFFLLSYRKALVAPHEMRLPLILLYQPLDALLFVADHVLFQLPMFFQGPRRQYYRVAPPRTVARGPAPR
jgi:hypothetical protein